MVTMVTEIKNARILSMIAMLFCCMGLYGARNGV